MRFEKLQIYVKSRGFVITKKLEQLMDSARYLIQIKA